MAALHASKRPGRICSAGRVQMCPLVRFQRPIPSRCAHEAACELARERRVLTEAAKVRRETGSSRSRAVAGWLCSSGLRAPAGCLVHTHGRRLPGCGKPPMSARVVLPVLPFWLFAPSGHPVKAPGTSSDNRPRCRNSQARMLSPPFQIRGEPGWSGMIECASMQMLQTHLTSRHGNPCHVNFSGACAAWPAMTAGMRLLCLAASGRSGLQETHTASPRRSGPSPLRACA